MPCQHLRHGKQRDRRACKPSRWPGLRRDRDSRWRAPRFRLSLAGRLVRRQVLRRSNAASARLGESAGCCRLQGSLSAAIRRRPLHGRHTKARVPRGGSMPRFGMRAECPIQRPCKADWTRCETSSRGNPPPNVGGGGSFPQARPTPWSQASRALRCGRLGIWIEGRASSECGDRLNKAAKDS